MPEITRLLDAAAGGDQQAAAELLPLVYDELRRLAAAKLASEKPGQTLSATALVHEAYLRLVGGDPDRHWDGRGHFFAAAAEAIRRILVEQSRRKQSLKRGGGRDRIDLEQIDVALPESDDELLALDEALTRLGAERPAVAELVKLRFFAGLTSDEAASTLGISPATAYRQWTFAQAWLVRAMSSGS